MLNRLAIKRCYMDYKFTNQPGNIEKGWFLLFMARGF
jgi:hypothetical protein